MKPIKYLFISQPMSGLTKYSNFNFYLNQILTFKKNGKPKNYDSYCDALREEIIHLMELPIDKKLITNRLMNTFI